MAIPSFDELLQQAKALGESRQPSAAYKGVKGGFQFLDKLLNTGFQPRETYGGAVSPEGEVTAFDTSKSQGGTVLQQLFGGPRLEQNDLAGGKIPIGRDKAASFLMARSLAGSKPKDTKEQTLGEKFPGKTDKELEQITGLKGAHRGLTFEQAGMFRRPDPDMTEERIRNLEEERGFRREQTIASNQRTTVDKFNADPAVRKAQQSLEA